MALPSLEMPPMPDDLARRIKALGQDARTAARVAADMRAMARRLGADVAKMRAREPLESLAAETCCAACDVVGRCHDYLAGGDDRPEEFCPNAARFARVADS